MLLSQAAASAKSEQQNLLATKRNASRRGADEEENAMQFNHNSNIHASQQLDGETEYQRLEAERLKASID